MATDAKAGRGRRSRGRPARFWPHAATAVALGGSLMVAGASALAPSALASGQAASLMPAGGQFVSVPISVVLPAVHLSEKCGVKTPQCPGWTRTFSVTGADGVPAGADAVVVNISAANTTASGFLTAYDADSSDTGVASVGYSQGTSASQVDTIPVGSAGMISVTNQSVVTAVDVTVTVSGYFTGASLSSAGDTYFPAAWSKIVDTTSGLGVPKAQVPAGGSITVQITGNGIAAGADTAVVQMGALNASQGGWLSAYPAGTTDPAAAALTYARGGTYSSLAYVPLSSAGMMTITNHGPVPVDVTIVSSGYFMPPATTPAGGEYWPVDDQMVYGTALAANASATFQVTGTGEIPTTGITEVGERVIVSTPGFSGSLDAYPAGGTDPNQPILSFGNVPGTYVGFEDSVLSVVAPTGQETITNHSTGTVNVQVAVTGWFQAPTVPGQPGSVSASVSGNSATVSWTAPSADGGSPVTGYTVSASPDNASVTVGSGTLQGTLTGLADASADTFTVTSANAVGVSSAGIFAPAAGTVTGTVVAPSGTPVPGQVVSIYASDPPSWSDISWTPDLLGTATTDANGNWLFTVPPYASLPLNAQAAASSNGGYLNVDAYADATATSAVGNTYDVTAFGGGSPWVGTGTSGPAPEVSAPASQVMTMQPLDVTDASAQDTPANEAATWVSQHSPTLTDSGGSFTGDAANAYVTPPADAYGYQEIGGNGAYDPYMTSDGTNLQSVPVTPNIAPARCRWTGPWTVVPHSPTWGWTIVGDQHADRDATGWLTYEQDASTSIAVDFSINGGAFGFDYNGTFSSGKGWSTGITEGPNKAYQNVLALDFEKITRTKHCSVVNKTYKYVKIVHEGVHSEPSNTKWDPYTLGASVLSQDGQSAWDAARYRSALRRNQGWCLIQNKGQAFSIGVTVYGLGISTETDHSSSTQQCIQEGPSSNITHHVWGSDGFIWNYPRVMRSW